MKMSPAIKVILTIVVPIASEVILKLLTEESTTTKTLTSPEVKVISFTPQNKI